MKKFGVLLLVIVLLAVVAVPTFATQTGVSGRLWDSKSPSATWANGASIYATNCDSSGNILGSELYATISVAPTGNPSTEGVFDAAWGVDDLSLGSLVTPAAPDIVCLYIQWTGGAQGTPADTLTAGRPIITFLPGRINYGNIQSGTGPTAINLSGITTGSQSTLPLVAGLAALVLAGFSFVAIRRRSMA